MKKNIWTKIALFYFFLIGTFGLLWRALQLYDIPHLDQIFLKHAHSHTAFQGWVYTILFVAIFHIYNLEKLENKRNYVILFWLAQASILGVSLSFPVQGYAFYSILFSSIFVVFSYAFSYRLFRDLPRIPDIKERHPLSLAHIKAGIFYFVFSSLGLWGIGPIIAKGLKGSIWYDLSIYFYLHFQYNGAFAFIVLGLFFWILEKEGIAFPEKVGWHFFWLFNIACIPSYLLSALWTQPPLYVVIIADIAAVMLFLAWVHLMLILKKISLASLSPWVRWLIYISFSFFSLKILMQVSAGWPSIARQVAALKHSVIIGYLHVSLIGFVSIMIMAFLIYAGKMIIDSLIAKSGLILFFVAFLLMETLLFTDGALKWFGWGFVPHQAQWLFWITIFMPLGLLLLLISQFLPEPTEE